MREIKYSTKPTLSVIIPMYNCSPVIVRCMDSIDYPYTEIIVVNDGSTDDGAKVVAQYAAIHPQVRLFNKSNGGVSSARNLGITKATGKYIAFVDADDYLASGGLNRIIDLAEQYHADVVKYCIRCLDSNAPYIQNSVSDTKMSIEVISGKAKALNRYDISDYHVVDAIFKAETIRKNNVQFFTDLHLREDDAFMGAFYSVCSQVVITSLPLYNYYTSSYFSHTHSQPIERQRLLIQSGLLAIQHRSQFIAEHCPNETFELERYKYMRWVCSTKDAISAKLTYEEYITLLDAFHQVGVYPLSYQWIKYAGFDYAWKPFLKRVIRTFMINHPLIGYPIAKLYYKLQRK